MTPYRVLVVDDSAFMRKLISDLIGENIKFTVTATASTGKEALEMLNRHKPDVITMDLEMPEMNGLEALQHIMRIQPTPVIMLAGISEEVTRETIKALQLGAFDFIRKPSKSIGVEEVGLQLQEKLTLAVTAGRKKTGLNKSVPSSSLKKAGGPKRTPDSNKPEIAKSLIAPPTLPDRSGRFRDLVAVGTSTGGPRALYQLLTALPEMFPAPVLVIQHMPPKFTKSLAQRLDTQCKLHVTEAVQGERVKAGVVYIAPGSLHMELDKQDGGYIIRLSDREPRHGHRPSVDVLFESLLEFKELRRHAVIMTGMGSDGARGMKALTEQGIDSAIAESEETCVIYGMPRSAIETGGARTVLPVYQIASHLVEAVNRSKV